MSTPWFKPSSRRQEKETKPPLAAAIRTWMKQTDAPAECKPVLLAMLQRAGGLTDESEVTVIEYSTLQEVSELLGCSISKVQRAQRKLRDGWMITEKGGKGQPSVHTIYKFRQVTDDLSENDAMTGQQDDLERSNPVLTGQNPFRQVTDDQQGSFRGFTGSKTEGAGVAVACEPENLGDCVPEPLPNQGDHTAEREEPSLSEEERNAFFRLARLPKGWNDGIDRNTVIRCIRAVITNGGHIRTVDEFLDAPHLFDRMKGY